MLSLHTLGELLYRFNILMYHWPFDLNPHEGNVRSEQTQYLKARMKNTEWT